MKLDSIAISRLKPAPYNPRTLTDSHKESLRRSLDEFGLVEPLVWNKQTKHVVGGNQRLALLKESGVEKVDVVVVDLPLAREKLLNLRLNKLSGEWDMDKLSVVLKEIDPADWGLTGFDDIEIQPLVFDAPIVEDDVPEPPKKAITKPGDLWTLGEHRVLCGDATKAEDVALLMDGANAQAVVTDPPYGVAIVKRGMVGADFGVARKGRYAPVAGDERTPDVRHVLELAAQVVMWGGNYFADQLPPSGSWFVWDKRCESGIENTFADCELAWSNIGGPARVHRQLWNGMIREGEHDKRAHPTQKPIGLMAWCIGKTDGLVLDPFLGSGTTLIAAEQLGRKCYGLEIEPRYCDVIVERWQNLTGGKAKLER